MRKEIMVNNVKIIIDTERYNGVFLKGLNGNELFFGENDTIQLSRFFDLLPYRKDVIYYLSDEVDMKDRVSNEEYVTAVTEEYERLRFDAEVNNWRDCLEEAVNNVDYNEYIDWDEKSEQVHKDVQSRLDKVFSDNNKKSKTR